MDIQGHGDAGDIVKSHFDGLAHPHVVKGRITLVRPYIFLASGGPDHGHHLVVVHVGIVLAEVTYPVPVGLMGLHGRLLGSFVQDSE